MPIIPNHLRFSPWSPRQPWADDCMVQWGRDGVVLSGREGRLRYRTAFFEAFPRDGSCGFLRGEGSDLAAAELHAYESWSRYRSCQLESGHRWTRTRRLADGKTFTYTNGGTFCLKCSSFETTMTPIVVLGGWRKPLSRHDLTLIGMGMVRPSEFGEGHGSLLRRVYLRSRLAGMVLPPEPDVTVFGDSLSAAEAYEDACEAAITGFVLSNIDRLRDDLNSGIAGLFERAALHYLVGIAECDEKGAPDV